MADQGKINEVDIVANDPAQSAAIAQHIDQVFANSASPTYTQTEKNAYAVGDNFGGLDVGAVARDIALAGLVMILFLTANVIVQSVRERFAEFATLRAIGFSDWAGLGDDGAGSCVPLRAGRCFRRGIGAGPGGSTSGAYATKLGLPPAHHVAQRADVGPDWAPSSWRWPAPPFLPSTVPYGHCHHLSGAHEPVAPDLDRPAAQFQKHETAPLAIAGYRGRAWASSSACCSPCSP